MPEGDTLARTAAGLRPYLEGRIVNAARAQGPGPVPQVHRLIGQRVQAVEAHGKNLIIRFDGGLELRTHLRMNGSWHRYRPGERWRRPPARARLVLEVDDSVAVCFDAPVVELFEQRTEHLHPSLSRLGPDLAAPDFDAAEAHRRLRHPERAGLEVAVALLDQRALAGIGNVFKNEILWLERVSPFQRVGDLDDPTLDRLIAGPPADARQCGCPSRAGARDDGRGSWGARAAVRVRSGGPAVPPLRRAHPGGAPGHGSAAEHVLVPELPGRDAMTHDEVTVQVSCAATTGGWRCSVDADDGRTAGHHEVTVTREDAERLAVARDEAAVVRLVEETFDFLLDREPRSSILATFDLTVVSRYFPEFEAEISARLAP